MGYNEAIKRERYQLSLPLLFLLCCGGATLFLLIVVFIKLRARHAKTAESEEIMPYQADLEANRKNEPSNLQTLISRVKSLFVPRTRIQEEILDTTGQQCVSEPSSDLTSIRTNGSYGSLENSGSSAGLSKNGRKRTYYKCVLRKNSYTGELEWVETMNEPIPQRSNPKLSTITPGEGKVEKRSIDSVFGSNLVAKVDEFSIVSKNIQPGIERYPQLGIYGAKNDVFFNNKQQVNVSYE
ncbi:hypothetical protein AX774_g8160 [Zancudomyces culisetae]|uniref:Uncharacterized protein n=1 Tax=Zancudomyces culisetae TaxID=1213189 RepID=A0A1R1PBU8_ZANCU|nr:hypothetical protein AX774_g8160 [Zancudomyces culisetae]|eukprot:OMH78447.1 hypothetical protein AX774_g8160 [Zancudomyces culisetae]